MNPQSARVDRADPLPSAPSAEILDLAARLQAGERRALARAVTLVESTRADHRRAARALLTLIAPRTGGALRLGLTGVPGVGKSTFIESLGGFLTGRGHKVAVLTVDPSSSRSGGSILGDKTRMERLSRDPQAFIRPSPSSGELGGVGRRSREAILLCEAAGHDVVIVETVGVGQSETMVADMTDVFLLLLAPAGGDELQGVKRGIMELADLVAVNKADGDLKAAAQRTRADYAGALRLMRRQRDDAPGFPKALALSALEEQGVAELWAAVAELDGWRREHGHRDQRRGRQGLVWMRDEIRRGLMAGFSADPERRTRLARLEAEVASGRLTPDVAAEEALEGLFS
ncbi:methylmalonyl Co-A mutase-associated GTPase MeaB [Neomegalonema sp.]|uniref:methylmalonyl Co-A mutase-associated GTPase MeaB n=1 Tax=Neomegalonema sp. TaxID=2039713 RepID=UPI0026129198|nr:methylmalonyl Co-A mutase-associated GTPase MeaB [Neomegalonema sp.]MDD2868930.1 methylmalonyl Co-A mutase-associated GTPase MeaB [Neomegalonema sp.]